MEGQQPIDVEDSGVNYTGIVAGLQNLVDSFEKDLNAEAAQEAAESSQEDRRPVEGKARLVSQLEEALQANEVGSRGALGQAFTDYLRKHPEEKEAYAGLASQEGSTMQLKKAFRVKWAQQLLMANTTSVRIDRDTAMIQSEAFGTNSGNK